MWNKVLIPNVCEAEKCYKHLQICTNRNPKRFGAFGHVLVEWITKKHRLGETPLLIMRSLNKKMKLN